MPHAEDTLELSVNVGFLLDLPTGAKIFREKITFWEHAPSSCIQMLANIHSASWQFEPVLSAHELILDKSNAQKKEKTRHLNTLSTTHFFQPPVRFRPVHSLVFIIKNEVTKKVSLAHRQLLLFRRYGYYSPEGDSPDQAAAICSSSHTPFPYKNIPLLSPKKRGSGKNAWWKSKPKSTATGINCDLGK